LEIKKSMFSFAGRDRKADDHEILSLRSEAHTCHIGKYISLQKKKKKCETEKERRKKIYRQTERDREKGKGKN
jgi:hypothetical protein